MAKQLKVKLSVEKLAQLMHLVGKRVFLRQNVGKKVAREEMRTPTLPSAVALSE